MSDTAPIRILPQPDDTTCGPTCLHAIYAFYGEMVALGQVIDEIDPLPTGGTLAVHLACHALERGYRATIYTYNLTLFDPTWFDGSHDLADCLRAQRAAKPNDDRLGIATKVYLHYLSLGGRVEHPALTAHLLERLLADGPILTGLSATYLYDCAREKDDDYDDIGGDPSGHFVLLWNLDPDAGDVAVADPQHDNPAYGSAHYRVSLERLIGAILLGVVTYDANLLVLRPRG